ncbi:cytochrome b/b6 domain-containing protein [Radicibacter daui]|uniref:cytochrome b/b6 domain-containing protein n=1 Tax=Radicibacter daui TaxID=3064829 RepID=UPI004046EB28
MTDKAGRDRTLQSRTVLVRRHSLVTRITHWLNAVNLLLLLMSGLQIFNAHPELYWGQYGADGDPAVLTIGARETESGLSGFIRAGEAELSTTGVLGVSRSDGEPTVRAFPAWITLPSYQDLGAGRGWHFLFAWFFVLNGLVYLSSSFLSGHFRRNLAPVRGQFSLRHLAREIADHARLRFPEGDAARHYNALQKLTYLIVIFLMLPAMLLTGLTMSPGMDAALPWLVDLFGGRQSARTIHFVTASLLALFVFVHVAMVVLSGPWNNLRSMVTGQYAIRYREPRS